MRRICPSQQIWKRDLATRRKSLRKQSGVRPKWGWLDARSRTRRATRTVHSTILACVAAAAQAAHALPFPFVLTARAHNLLYAPASLEDTISRLQAFEKAGADVLFAPGLPDLAAVRAVCRAVSKPVNFMVGIKGKSFSVSELAAAGVKRISLATSLYRAAMTGFLDAANEVREKGQFGFLDRSVTTPELNKLMGI